MRHCESASLTNKHARGSLPASFMASRSVSLWKTPSLQSLVMIGARPGLSFMRARGSAPSQSGQGGPGVYILLVSNPGCIRGRRRSWRSQDPGAQALISAPSACLAVEDWPPHVPGTGLVSRTWECILSRANVRQSPADFSIVPPPVTAVATQCHSHVEGHHLAP